MNILILTQYYTPEPLMRPGEMAPILVQRGHEVTVLTAFPSYPTGRIYDGYKNNRWRWERIDGVDVLRLPVFPDRTLSLFRRMLYWTSVSAQAALIAPLLRKNFDFAFVYSPPITLGLPAIFAKWFRGVPFIYEVQDLFPESLTATDLVHSRLVLNAILWAEKINYRQAAAVSVISAGFKRNLEAKGVPGDKIHVIPNWADESVYTIAPRDPELARRLGCEGRFNVVYAGNMGPPQSLETIIDCAALMQDKPDVQFLLVGDGAERAALMRKAEKTGLRNLRFVGPVPPSAIPGIFSLADVLLLHLKKCPLFAITIPSKTIAYLASGRPIVGGIEGDAAEVITDARAGLTCEPQNPEAMRGCIERLRAMPAEQREQLGSNGRNAFLAHYRKELLVTRIEDLSREIARTRNGKRA